MLVLSRNQDGKIDVGGELEIEVIRMRWASAHVHFSSSNPFHALRGSDYAAVFGRPFQFTNFRHEVSGIKFPEPPRAEWCFELRTNQSIIVPALGSMFLVCRIQEYKIRLGCEVPRAIVVHRDEVLRRIEREGAHRTDSPE